MNRLILIGNGFDLAHGLKTTYKDFMRDYMCNAINLFFSNNKFDDEFIEINYNHKIENDYQYETSEDIKNFIALFVRRNKAVKITFKCGFFQKLFEKTHIENWVNIESEYFYYLNDLLKKGISIKTETSVHDFNNNFEILKYKIVKYIETVRDNAVFDGQIGKYHFKFNKNYDNKSDKNTIIDNLMFLNFNYTRTVANYFGHTLMFLKDAKKEISNENITINNIHGELNNPENPIIFGFGDEYDAEYQKFEHLQNNELFRHVKSFAYFRTENYQNLIRFMEMDEFEVGIAGHSCGLSDRTLLKHIFEHNNCKRLKIFHHKRKDNTTNYTELTYEIARHFTDKKKMREKIIPFNVNDSL